MTVTVSGIVRSVFNLLIVTGLLLLFNAFDWLTLNHDGARIAFSTMTWSIFGSVLLIGIVMWVVGIIVGLLYAISVVVSLGLMILAYPFIGWAVLEGTEHFLPSTLMLHGFWITALCGFLLLYIRIPSFSKDD